jgi:hypothetical protein
VGAIDHLVGDLLAAMSRETMHHDDVVGGEGHGLRVEPVGRHHQDALLVLRLLAHRRPHVRVQHVGTFGSRLGVVRDLAAPARLLADLVGPLHHLRDGLEAGGGGHAHPHPEQGPAQEQGVRDVVAVAEVGERLPRGVARPLDHRLQVGQDLARVLVVGERVHHRDVRGRGQGLEPLLAERAHHDGVHVPAQDPAGVLDRLPPPELEIVGGQDHGVAAHRGDPDLERDAGPGGGLLEDDGDLAARQGVRMVDG